MIIILRFRKQIFDDFIVKGAPTFNRELPSSIKSLNSINSGDWKQTV